MAITLLDLYNKTASQPWSMFDNDAVENDDFEPALISAINKALVEIWCSYPFEFRLKHKKIITQKYINKYPLPDGTILQKSTKLGERYSVILNRRYLEFVENPELLEFELGKPEGFYIKNNSLCFYPAPDDTYTVNVDYLTFSVGVDSYNKPIYALCDVDDKIVIPEKYEQLFLSTLMSKSMMYALSATSDENFSGYAIEYEKAYKLLIKSAGGRKKNRRISF